MAQIILRAGRSHLEKGYWDLVVEDDAYDRLDLIEMLTVLETRSSCHYSGFRLATVNGMPAGAAAGFDPVAEEFMERGHALAAGFGLLDWSNNQVAAAFTRLEPFKKCLPRFSPGAWVVEWVGVMPAFRGMGLGGRLITTVLELGRSRGYRRAEVATYLDNAPAIAAYRRLGFTAAEERRHPEFERVLGSPGMILMARGL